MQGIPADWQNDFSTTGTRVSYAVLPTPFRVSMPVDVNVLGKLRY